MGFFSFARDGRVIAAGLCAASVGLLVSMRLVLEYIKEQNEVKPPQLKSQFITQETEDSLKLNTLESLLGHYNYAIRETSAKIICDRALNDSETVNHLLYGITRPDYDERMRSLRTLALIIDPKSLDVLHTQMGYSALVRSLELCTQEYPQGEKLDPDYDDYPLRDMSEKFCLMFVIQLLNKGYDSDMLLKAKFVEKWVARQAWGDTTEERQLNFVEYLICRQNRIGAICMKIKASRRGREALERAGLLPVGGADEDLDTGDEDEDENHTGRFSIVLSINMAGGRSGDEGEGEGDDLQVVETFQPRVMEQSAAEQRIRRQHREAMVLNDGTRPLGRGDIIERDHHD